MSGRRLGVLLAAALFGVGANWDVRVRDIEGQIHVVPLEPYVERSVAAEVYASWPREVLKAQAVAARTYVLYERARNSGRSHHVEATVLSQRYTPKDAPRAVQDASRATRGEYLGFGEGPILAAFHSSAGGRTASAAEVWGLDLPYLRSVQSPDDASPDYFWSYEIALQDLWKVLGEAGLTPADKGAVRVLHRSRSGRVRELELGGVRISGRELRQVLGGRAIRSARFDVHHDGTRVRFLGSGAGHGVGLCQWGAREMARQGKTYTEILAHYYPGTELRRLGDPADVAARGPAHREVASGRRR